ncbi:hypothetical protein PCE1_002158 [Barthelona sp. PCE]
MVNKTPEPIHQPVTTTAERFFFVAYEGFFNLISNVIFATLLPMQLKRHNAFSQFNTATSIGSWICFGLISFLGSLLDLSRNYLLGQVGFGVTAFILAAIAVAFASNGITVAFTGLTCYVLAITCMKASVISNNSLLGYFERSVIKKLSLLSTGFGFAIEMVMYIFLYYFVSYESEKHTIFGLYELNLWNIITLFIALVLLVMSAFTFDPKVFFSFKFSRRNFFSRTFRTYLRLLFKKKLRNLRNFIFAHFFYTSAMLFFSRYLTLLLIDLFDYKAKEVMFLHIFFAFARIVSILLGLLLRRKSSKGTLLIQVLCISICFFGMFGVKQFHTKIEWVRPIVFTMSFIVSFIFGWNMALSRTVLIRLVPKSHACYFGVYVCVAILGMAALSSVVSLITFLKLEKVLILCVLGVWSLLGVFFIFFIDVDEVDDDDSEEDNAIEIGHDDSYLLIPDEHLE